MIGADLFLVGIEKDSLNYVENANSCSMCKRMIINAGINRIVIRDNIENYRTIDVLE